MNLYFVTALMMYFPAVILTKSNSNQICPFTLYKPRFDFETSFNDLYEVCHDTSRHHTIWTKFILNRDAAAFKKLTDDAVEWLKDPFFQDIDPSDLYKTETQFLKFKSIIGSADKTKSFFVSKEGKRFYLVEGHMVDSVGFLMKSEQIATFSYVNAAPQWNTIKDGNWAILENYSRQLASNINKDLVVYTGNWGIATLPTLSKIQAEIYLDPSRKLMPIPQMFWKVLYDPDTWLGIAFVVLNNPHKSITATDVRCRDICDIIRINIAWNPLDTEKGHSYCCEVNDFRNAFPELPNFPTTGVLIPHTHFDL